MRKIRGISEKQVLETIETVINRFCKTFTFGYFDLDDIKQEARLFCIKSLDKYDEKQPLENFLHVVVKRRLLNLKRDKFKRSDPPCKLCHNKLENDTGHKHKQYCQKYLAWYNRNISKQNIMNPIDIYNISDEKEKNTRQEDTTSSELEIKEVLKVIDKELDVSMRSVYLQMRAGVYVPKYKKRQIEEKVKQIIAEKVYGKEAEE